MDESKTPPAAASPSVSSERKAPRIFRTEAEWTEYIISARPGPGFEQCVAYAVAMYGDQRESAAYARGLADAFRKAADYFASFGEKFVADGHRIAAEIRAIAGTEAQPPPDARVKELLEALRAARPVADALLSLLFRIKRDYTGKPWRHCVGCDMPSLTGNTVAQSHRNDCGFADIETAARSLLGASDPLASLAERVAPTLASFGEHVWIGEVRPTVEALEAATRKPPAGPTSPGPTLSAPAAGVPTADELDRLERLLSERTAGVWKLCGMDVMADQDGTSNQATAKLVARTFDPDRPKMRTFDASLICDLVRLAPALIACARARPAALDLLTRLLQQIDTIRGDSEGRYPRPDPGCIVCTSGAVPDDQNRGPCAEHAARAAMERKLDNPKEEPCKPQS
jgi:hypothetical protein